MVQGTGVRPQSTHQGEWKTLTQQVRTFTDRNPTYEYNDNTVDGTIVCALPGYRRVSKVYVPR